MNIRSRESIGRSEKRNVRLSCGRKVQDKDVLLWLEPKVQECKTYTLCEGPISTCIIIIDCVVYKMQPRD